MISDKELEKLLKEYGPKQVESFWINSIIELLPKQRKRVDEEMKKRGKTKKFQQGE